MRARRLRISFFPAAFPLIAERRQGGAWISLPAKTGALLGLPVGEPPAGSTVIAKSEVFDDLRRIGAQAVVLREAGLFDHPQRSRRVERSLISQSS